MRTSAGCPFFGTGALPILVVGMTGASFQSGCWPRIQPRAEFAVCVAEREGFEPSIRFCRILTFQASAFDHSATAPQYRWKGAPVGKVALVGNLAGARP